MGWSQAIAEVVPIEPTAQHHGVARLAADQARRPEMLVLHLVVAPPLLNNLAQGAAELRTLYDKRMVTLQVRHERPALADCRTLEFRQRPPSGDEREQRQPD